MINAELAGVDSEKRTEWRSKATHAREALRGLKASIGSEEYMKRTQG